MIRTIVVRPWRDAESPDMQASLEGFGSSRCMYVPSLSQQTSEDRLAWRKWQRSSRRRPKLPPLSSSPKMADQVQHVIDSAEAAQAVASARELAKLESSRADKLACFFLHLAGSDRAAHDQSKLVIQSLRPA